jgi:hypothetical protein
VAAFDRQSDQEAFLKAWLTPRVIGSALSPAIFCPSADSSLVCSVILSNCFLACDVHSSTMSDGCFAVASWRGLGSRLSRVNSPSVKKMPRPGDDVGAS